MHFSGKTSLIFRFISTAFALVLISSCYASDVRPALSIIGFVLQSDGIGRIAPELQSALLPEMSVELVPVDLHSLSRSRPEESIKEYINSIPTPNGDTALFVYDLRLPQADAVIDKIFKEPQSDQIRIVYSMFESDEIPDLWVPIINNYFDAVAVPDKYYVDIYKNCGVEIPVFEIPLGLNLSKLLELPIKKEKNKPFVFGNLGYATHRKNVLTLIKAFTKAFGPENNKVSLKLNCRHDRNGTFELLKKEIKNSNAKNIKLTKGVLTEEKYNKTLASMDVYVSLSKGEGFSIQPREAMSLGIPVIATNNTAQGTICESGLVRVVSSDIREPASLLWLSPTQINRSFGNMFNCKVEDAAEALLDVYNNYDSFLKNSTMAREWSRQYDYSMIKTLYKNFLDPKKIILGNENRITQDYLMTTSSKLYEKWSNILTKKSN